MGLFSLLETTGVTLLGPVLAKLPKPLQRARIGPLAPTETYSARFIVNAPGCASDKVTASIFKTHMPHAAFHCCCVLG